MKYLLMCEGTNEQTIIDLLLDNNKLIINRDNLIGRKPYVAKQLHHPILQNELRRYGKPVIIYRIGDTLTDELRIPKNLTDIISKNNIYKYCTKPELEILLIITENLFDVFKKKHEKCKSFAKSNIQFNGIRYNQTNQFLQDYYGGKRINALVESVKKYKKYCKHDKNELYLADLLK